jgi:hypothetical protein
MGTVFASTPQTTFALFVRLSFPCFQSKCGNVLAGGVEHDFFFFAI